MKRRELLFVLVCFFLWQILLTGIIFLGKNFVPFRPDFAYTEIEIVNPPFLWSRANFDGIQYLDIARKGYGIYQQAFFPLYPTLIRKLTPIFRGKSLIAALSMSWTSHFLALCFLYKLVILDFDKKIARRTIFYLLLFPTAFYFSMVYTESLFLFLVLASFYFARTKKWLWAGIFGALASGTQLPGIFLFPALLVEWRQQKDKKKPTPLIPLLFIPLGLFFYMRFLHIKFHDPLMFFHVQPFFGTQGIDKLVLLYQVFWRYFKMLWTVQKRSLTYFVVVIEFLTGAGFLGALIWSYLKKIRPSYVIFAALAYIAPTLTGTFSSLPRYVLVCFPCFIVLALIKNRILRFVLFLFSFLLLIVCTTLFTRGYWIA